MTELALSFVRPRRLGLLTASPERRLERWTSLLEDANLAAWLAPLAPTHLYLGSELCEHLLPDAETLAAARSFAEDRGLALALLTPIASPAVIRELDQVLLPQLPDGAEVIVNDWGVARLLAERSHAARLHAARFPRLAAIAGRLLARMVKDPRLTGDEWAPHCRHGLRSPGLRALLERLAMRRLELDVPLHATVEDFAQLPLPVGVHLPFFVVAKGRLCRIGSTGLTGAERFAPGRRCKRECLHLSATMTRPSGADRYETLQLGNALLARHSAAMVAAVEGAVTAGHVTRLVVQGEPL
ncbi:MAG: hypothetical protein U1F35_03675 [Steroidobacteraceae bacterium]